VSAAKFTPGPWHSANVSLATWNVGVYDQTGTSVALLKVSSALHVLRREADARLIAAAPDLLDALVLAEDVLARRPYSSEIWPNGTHPFNGIEQIRAAIAKATGETS